MRVIRNKYLIGILSIGILLLLVLSLLTVSASYFNTKELSTLSSQCYENGGEVTLEIYNDFTSDYSFECELPR